MPADVTFMGEMSVEEKMAILDSLPAGTIMLIPGHEMMYLGKVDGRYYVINDSSSIMPPGDDAVVMRPSSVIINDLNFRVKSGISWLERLSYAVVIK